MNYELKTGCSTCLLPPACCLLPNFMFSHKLLIINFDKEPSFLIIFEKSPFHVERSTLNVQRGSRTES